MILDDKTLESLNFKPQDINDLDTVLRGAVIVGCEPCGDPLTDGLTLYFRGAAGGLTALFIGSNETQPGDDLPPLDVAMATIQNGESA